MEQSIYSEIRLEGECNDLARRVLQLSTALASRRSLGDIVVWLVLAGIPRRTTRTSLPKSPEIFENSFAFSPIYVPSPSRRFYPIHPSFGADTPACAILPTSLSLRRPPIIADSSTWTNLNG